MIVDCAAYVKGRRMSRHMDLSEAMEASREPGVMVWIGLHEPTAAEFEAVQEEFGLHRLAVEDALKSHQRPKIECYDGVTFAVLKTARWMPETSTIEFAELHLFVGPDFVVSVRHGQASALADLRHALETQPEVLALGTGAIVHAIFDRVIDDYEPVIERLEAVIEEIEAHVFSPQRRNPAERIFRLKREVLTFLRNTSPLRDALDAVLALQVPVLCELPQLANYFRDVDDHLRRFVARAETCNELLTSVLGANLAQVSMRQNNDMRTISAWAAVIAVPTMLAGVWGMNFAHMPELDWYVGYPFAIVVMFGAALAVYVRMRRAEWL